MGNVFDELMKLLGPNPGVSIFLLVAVYALAKLYLAERRKCEKNMKERLVETREDTALVVAALTEATATVSAYKEQNNALTVAITSMLQATALPRGNTND